LAHIYSARVGLPMPEYTRALRLLLGGNPCTKCQRHMMTMLAARVHPTGTPARPAPVRAVTAASSKPGPTPAAAHSRDCSPCAWRRAGDALLASRALVGSALPEKMASFVAEGRRPHTEYVTHQVPEKVELLPNGHLMVSWRRTGTP